MKKIKAMIIYGMLGALCLAAFAGYLTENLNKAKSQKQQTSAVSIQVHGEAGSSDSSQQKAPRMTVEEKVGLANKKPDPEPTVGIARGADHAAVTRKAVENAGTLQQIIKKGDTVLIKPNLGAPPINPPDDTDVRIAEEIVRIVKELGAGKIIIAEGSYTGGVFEMADYTRIQGVEFVDTNLLKKEDCYQIKPERSLTGEGFYIPKVYMDADVVISAAKLKTYNLVGATLSLKNVFGVPPATLYGSIGAKTKLHTLGVNEAVVDLNRIRKPDFAVIDGIVGGEGPGPFGNLAVNSEIVIAGNDLVAVDAVASNFMGFEQDEIRHIKMAAEYGLGIDDLSKIRVVGGELNSIRMKFRR